jgi:hypothetical protein
MKLGDGFHLTYCSNIHPGETWEVMSDALRTSLPCIREILDYSGAMAEGLRLSAQAAAALDQQAPLDRFRAFLRAGNYYVFTINGFPYGAFHGERVKRMSSKPISPMATTPSDEIGDWGRRSTTCLIASSDAATSRVLERHI